jgi:hypothetical protein
MNSKPSVFNTIFNCSSIGKDRNDNFMKKVIYFYNIVAGLYKFVNSLVVINTSERHFHCIYQNFDDELIFKKNKFLLLTQFSTILIFTITYDVLKNGFTR